MKRLAIAVTVLAIGAAGCGSSSTTKPSDNLVVFNVQLSALNEVPPITNAESTARGTAVITVDKVANTVDFSVSLRDFPASATVRVAHIHGPTGPAGATAGILVDTLLAQGDVVLTNGAGTFSFEKRAASAAVIAGILANPQNHYFNVHTVLNGGGAIRGQLQ